MEYGGQQQNEKEITLGVLVFTEVTKKRKDGLKAAGSEEG